MLDVRYHRDSPAPDKPAADMLGDAQWEWLRQQLQEPADLRLVVSGTQILLDSDTGSETWAQYPKARARLFHTIREAGVQGVVFLTGDQHYAEVCRMRNVLPYDAIELQFAGLNQIEEPEFNRLRVSPVCQSLNSFACLDIQWEQTAQDVPHLMFEVRDADSGAPEILYRVNLDELALQKQ